MSYKVIQCAMSCTITLRNKYMSQRETGNQNTLSDRGLRSTMTPCLLIPLGSAIFHFFFGLFSVLCRPLQWHCFYSLVSGVTELKGRHLKPPKTAGRYH